MTLSAGSTVADRPAGLLVTGAGAIATLAGGLRRGPGQGELALLVRRGPDDPDPPTIATWGDRIVAVGPRSAVEAAIATAGYPRRDFDRLEVEGRLITPGLVDPHTHLLFAGSRAGELLLRLRGADYLEILAAGGGILATVRETRAASPSALLTHGRRWLAEMLRHGTTTVEAKSGYGLDVATELRLLEVAGALGAEGPVAVVSTFLGAHAVPPEYRTSEDPDRGRERYVRHVIEEQLPAVAAQGLARFCDVFCEAGVFDVDEARAILTAARDHGLGLRLHADELAPSGGAELAAELGAVSADHLAAVSDVAIEALAAAADEGRPVVAVLLPATSWFLMKARHAPARRLIERGVPVALGTDFNPGTSPTPNLQLVLSLAVLELRMTPAEALAAVTANAAHALGLGDRVGSLEAGRDADFVVWDVASVDELPYWVGADLVRMVVKGGRVVVGRAGEAP
ncbi:MAG TPA: imidazolonepropionase [Candidatus Binatia bacterium]|nr:imidazolonepropionase [Candidatus Binatia bacterium]